MKKENIALERRKFVQQFENMLVDKTPVFFDSYAYERIMEYYESKVNFAKALKATECALNQHPFSAFFLLKKGEYLLEMKRANEALNYLEKALIFDPGDLRVYFVTSDAYIELGEYEKALDILHEAATLSDNDELPDVYLEIADVYEEMEKFQMVVKYIKKSLWRDPRHTEAQGRFQFTTEMNGLDKEAIEFLTKLSNKDPYSKNIWLNMGNAYSNLEALEDAAEAYEIAIAIDDQFDLAYEELGAVYFKMKRYDDAIANLKLAVKHNTILGLESSYFLLGKCYSELSDYSQALHYFNKTIQTDNNYIEAYYELACCHFELQNFKTALSNIYKALENNLDDFDYNLMAANILFSMNEMIKAKCHIGLALKSKPVSAEDWVAISETLFQNDEVEEAIELLLGADIEIGDKALIHYHLAAYYYDFGKRQEALACFTDALHLNYESHRVLFEIEPEFQSIDDFIDLIELYKP